MLTHERLRQVLDYDPATGTFTWRIHRGGRSAGSIAGCRFRKRPSYPEYIAIRVDGQLYQNAGRLAWFWMTGAMPAHEIDHKNRDPLDNSWTNLRHATSSQNKMNQRLRRDNTSGYTGVVFLPKRRKWRSDIHVNGQIIRLGYFASLETAAEAYRAAVLLHHGEFARVA